MRKTAAFALALLSFSLPSLAQDTQGRRPSPSELPPGYHPPRQLQTRPWHKWPIYREIVMPSQKILPPDRYHFRPVSEEYSRLRFKGNENAVCKVSLVSRDNPAAFAISFAKKLYEGESPLQAIDSMRKAHGGDIPCGFYNDGYFQAIEQSVRGDDENHPIFILKLRDVSGTIFFLGIPKD